MGKGARIACIFTPMALTIASFVCLALIEVAGWHKNTLPSYYFFKANLSNVDISASTDNAILTTAINTASNSLAQDYQVYLWNYCQSKTDSAELEKCSKRKSGFVFDPLSVWNLNISSGDIPSTGSSEADNAIEAAVQDAKDNSEQLEDKILGDSGRKALDAYRKVAKWMFIAYQISFWTTLATIVVGVLAIFSRWGSLLTWILAIVSSLFTLAAVLTSTILFSIVVSALNKALDDYNIKLSLGHQSLLVNWLGVAFSWAATLFWLFSVCCCSGRSNPHHRSNKGGLWNAEPKGQGYGDYGRGRGLTVEKTGGGYQRVASPYGAHEPGDQVPLHDFTQPGGFNRHQGAGYEPYRHS